ncbi:MAG TPA: polyphosphate kinase 1 [Verrucomicrobiota bacterium]|nr:polyphosphate kinase 1 [Verrucomicrobiales bacterium]HRI12146.1 polyphosphate kinase 1 [Verrucomicrobiota bacterium]
MAKQKPAAAPTAPSRYFNRELSWLEFNQRVLEEALDPSNPLLERLKFFCIVNSNLDEFFEVRVAGLKQAIAQGVTERGPDGLTAGQTLAQVRPRVGRLVDDAYRCWREQLVPDLAQHRINFLDPSNLTADDREWLAAYYRDKVSPVLTPLAVDPSHPFPQLLNKSLNLIVRLHGQFHGQLRRWLAVVQVPRALPRLVSLPRADDRHDYVFLSHLIAQHLADLFPGMDIEGCWSFRVTRNSELYIDEEEVPNLLRAVEHELDKRKRGAAVRLEVSADCPAEVRADLLAHVKLTEEDLYVVDGPVNPTRLMAVIEGDHSHELRDPPFFGPTAKLLRDRPDVFAVLRERDILLHHPYDSFNSVVEFLETAAADPKVLAIKQTLYRTGGDPRIVGALMNAVKNGKQVTAVVELKARFDEANNIRWALALEEAGVHVIYGIVGYKIHCKVALVVRADEDGIRRYVHLGTGNYNPSTARLYTDLGLLTCRPEFGADATDLFNLLTGICRPQETRRFVVAPFQMLNRVLELIDREAAHAKAGLPARIIAKMNALVDTPVIDALYRAAAAGVEIDLIIRGICCLRPGVPGLSERIRVRSIVDRFLEHARVWYFDNAHQPEVYVGSADWMPRNLHRRIEVAFPIEDGRLRDRIVGEILETQLQDNTKARQLHPDGSYSIPPRRKGVNPRRAQAEFMARVQQPDSKSTQRPRRAVSEKLVPKPRPERIR